MNLYAMDTCFLNGQGQYSIESQCEILADLGYGGCYLTVWGDDELSNLEKLPALAEKNGLRLDGVYVGFDIDPSENNERVSKVIERLPNGHGLELNVYDGSGRACSDTAGDDDACRALERILEPAAVKQIQVKLYPHITSWLERIEDGVRLCERLQHPLLGVIFCAYHWYAVDGEDLRRRLISAAAYLRGANINGSRKRANERPSIETLDEGDLDLFQVVAAIRSAGYQGPIGVQGWSIGGDVYHNLQRSMIAWNSIERRLRDHGNWVPHDS